MRLVVRAQTATPEKNYESNAATTIMDKQENPPVLSININPVGNEASTPQVVSQNMVN